MNAWEAIGIVIFLFATSNLWLSLPGAGKKIFSFALAVLIGIFFGRTIEGKLFAGLCAIVIFYFLYRVTRHRRPNSLTCLKIIIGFFVGITAFQYGPLEGFLIGALICAIVAFAAKITGLQITSQLG